MKDRDERMSLGSARDELDESIDALADAGFGFPVRDETLERWSKAAPEAEPSDTFRRRVSGLIGRDASRRDDEQVGDRTLGQTLAAWRVAAKLAPTDVARRVGLHREVVVDLEADEIFPETQTADVWRAFAGALGRSLEEIRRLIASAPRTAIHPQGSPAARLDRKLWRERAQFLTQDEKNEEAKLDARRRELLEALSKE